MSRFLEYLNLLPKGLKDADRVLAGLYNQVKLEFGILEEEKVLEITRRRAICEGCPFMSENAVKQTAFIYTTERTDKHCAHCGCPIATKTADLLSNCAIEYYNQNHPDNPLPLKWESTKTN